MRSDKLSKTEYIVTFPIGLNEYTFTSAVEMLDTDPQALASSCLNADLAIFNEVYKADCDGKYGMLSFDVIDALIHERLVLPVECILDPASNLFIPRYLYSELQEVAEESGKVIPSALAHREHGQATATARNENVSDG